jgi:deoxyhypusine synthase
MPHTKEEYLQSKIKPYNPELVNSVEEALEALQTCSFQGRNLGIGLEIWSKMVSEGSECLKVLTLSGAMIPAGMGEAICCAIERGFVDAIVSTGANITHDTINAILGQAHYAGSDEVNDDELFKYRIDRIYDTYIPEASFVEARKVEAQILIDAFGSEEATVAPSKMFNEVGKRLEARSMVSVAAQHDIPIFCGASSDSDFSLNLAEQRLRGNLKIVLDEVADVINFSDLIRTKDRHGTIIVGGGVPRNWGQQVFPFLDQIKVEMPSFGYNYSVRMHTAVVYDGGLSGCTVSEGKTWGKYVKNADHVSIWCDATIAFPLLVTGLVQRVKAGKI